MYHATRLSFSLMDKRPVQALLLFWRAGHVDGLIAELLATVRSRVAEAG